MRKIRRILEGVTPWDTWVLWSLMYGWVGTVVLLWMAVDRDSFNWLGFLGAVSCLIFCLIGLIIAQYRSRWLTDLSGDEDAPHL